MSEIIRTIKIYDGTGNIPSQTHSRKRIPKTLSRISIMRIAEYSNSIWKITESGDITDFTDIPGLAIHYLRTIKITIRMALEIVTIEDLRIFKHELVGEIRTMINESQPTKKQWLKSAEVRELLGISAGTLQTLRIKGILPYSKVGGTLYYDYQDVEKVLITNKKPSRNILGEL